MFKDENNESHLSHACILSVELCGRRQPGSEGERKRRRRKKDENGDEDEEGEEGDEEDDEEVKERMGELGLKGDAAGEAEVSINLLEKT